MLQRESKQKPMGRHNSKPIHHHLTTLTFVHTLTSNCPGFLHYLRSHTWTDLFPAGNRKVATPMILRRRCQGHPSYSDRDEMISTPQQKSFQMKSSKISRGTFFCGLIFNDPPVFEAYSLVHGAPAPAFQGAGAMMLQSCHGDMISKGHSWGIIQTCQ